MATKILPTTAPSHIEGPLPLALRISEFCKLYAISRGQYYKEVEEKRLNPTKRGKWVRIPRTEAERWFVSLAVSISPAHPLPSPSAE